MAKDGHWMEKAFANSHGQFKAKAKKAGMSTEGYAEKVEHEPGASTHLKRQANLAEIGHKYGGGHHKQPHGFGHSASQHHGKHRHSGHPGAHRIGSK